MKHNRHGKVTNCRHSYSLLQKIAAIYLARAVGKKPAARALGYHLSMIRKWCHAEENRRALINVRGVIPTDRRRLNGNGRKPLIHDSTKRLLVDWFDKQRNKNNTLKDGPFKLNIQHCMVKLCQLDGSLAAINLSSLRRRVWRIFRRRKITKRAVTHFAQKCRNNTSMIEGWQTYIKGKLIVSNIMFSHNSKQTLAHKVRKR
jgi:hypothetical protein